MHKLKHLFVLGSSDTPHGLKTSGFCTVTRADVFSQLLTSYIGMGHVPHTDGGCHRRNNVGDAKFPMILVPDVHGSWLMICLAMRCFLSSATLQSQ
jgi:hypothetical protein